MLNRFVLVLILSGPTNTRLRIQLGLQIPAEKDSSRMRLGKDSILHWGESAFVVFDESFEHEEWLDASSKTGKLVLTMDVAHPRRDIQDPAAGVHAGGKGLVHDVLGGCHPSLLTRVYVYLEEE